MNSQIIETRTNAKRSGQTSSPKAKFSAAQTAGEPSSKNEFQGKTGRQNNPEAAMASATPSREPVSATPTRETAFHLDAPAAHEVLLAGEFTDWDKAPIKLIKGSGGVWHTKVPLKPGRHCYRFLVDGKWQDDPNRPGRETNSFGTTNSFVEVL
jgi:hypothetical protein